MVSVSALIHDIPTGYDGFEKQQPDTLFQDTQKVTSHFWCGNICKEVEVPFDPEIGWGKP